MKLQFCNASSCSSCILLLVVPPTTNTQHLHGLLTTTNYSTRFVVGQRTRSRGSGLPPPPPPLTPLTPHHAAFVMMADSKSNHMSTSTSTDTTTANTNTRARFRRVHQATTTTYY